MELTVINKPFQITRERDGGRVQGIVLTVTGVRDEGAVTDREVGVEAGTENVAEGQGQIHQGKPLYQTGHPLGRGCLANKRTCKSQIILLAFSKSFFALDRLEGTRIEAAEGSDVVISLEVAEEEAAKTNSRWRRPTNSEPLSDYRPSSNLNVAAPLLPRRCANFNQSSRLVGLSHFCLLLLYPISQLQTSSKQ